MSLSFLLEVEAKPQIAILVSTTLASVLSLRVSQNQSSVPGFLPLLPSLRSLVISDGGRMVSPAAFAGAP